jgi:hypothetical protein
MKKYYKLIILVIANYTEKNSYKQFIDEYWYYFIEYIKKNNFNIKVFLLFGGKKPENIPIHDDDIIISNTKESFIPGILEKSLYALNYCNNNFDYKHILRTNISSFYVIDELINVQKKLPLDNVYMGILNGWFVAGCGIWLSKDIVQFIVDNIDKIPISKEKKILSCENKLVPNIDDVIFGNFFKEHKNIIQSFDKRFNYSWRLKEDKLSIVKEIITKKHYHIRLKNGRKREQDANMAIFLTNHFYK